MEGAGEKQAAAFMKPLDLSFGASGSGEDAIRSLGGEILKADSMQLQKTDEKNKKEAQFDIGIARESSALGEEGEAVSREGEHYKSMPESWAMPRGGLCSISEMGESDSDTSSSWSYSDSSSTGTTDYRKVRYPVHDPLAKTLRSLGVTHSSRQLIQRVQEQDIASDTGEDEHEEKEDVIITTVVGSRSPKLHWRRARFWVMAGTRMIRQLQRVRAVDRFTHVVRAVMILRRRLKLEALRLRGSLTALLLNIDNRQSSQRRPSFVDGKKRLETSYKNLKHWQLRCRARESIVFELLAWIESITGVAAVEKNDLLAAIRDGKVLCALIRSIWPDEPINTCESLGAEARIVNFLITCRQLNIGDSLLFEASDILQKNNEDAVVNALLRFALHAINESFAPPPCLSIELQSLLPSDDDEGASRFGDDLSETSEKTCDNTCHKAIARLRLLEDGEWFRMLDIASPPVEIVMSCADNTLMWCGIASSVDPSWPDLAENIPLANLRYIVEGCRAGSIHYDSSCFTIATDDRELLLQCESVEVRDRWVSALKYGSFLAKCDRGDFSVLELLLNCRIGYESDDTCSPSSCDSAAPGTGFSLASSLLTTSPLLRCSSSIGRGFKSNSITEDTSDALSTALCEALGALNETQAQMKHWQDERNAILCSLSAASAATQDTEKHLSSERHLRWQVLEESNRTSTNMIRWMDRSMNQQVPSLDWLANTSPNLRVYAGKDDESQSEHVENLTRMMKTLSSSNKTGRMMLKARRMQVKRDFRNAMKTLQDCCQMANRIGDMQAEHEATTCLAQLLLQLGQFSSSYVLLRKATALEEQLGMHVVSTWAQITAVSVMLSDHNKAVDRLQDLRRVFQESRSSNNAFALSLTLESLANEYIAVGSLDKAMPLLEQCTEIAKILDDPAIQRRLLHSKGNLHKRRGEVQEALDCYQQSKLILP